MKDSLNPPAIIKDYQDPKAIALEINQLGKDGLIASKSSIEKFRQAGKLLLQLKEILKGKYIEFIGANLDHSVRQCQRWCKLSKCSDDESLDGKWSIICGHKDDEDDDLSEKHDATPASHLPEPAGSSKEDRRCDNCKRKQPPGKSLAGCEACAEARKTKPKPLTVPPPEPPPPKAPEPPKPIVDSTGKPVPKTLLQVFQEVSDWEDAKRKTKAASEAVRKIEAGDTYARLNRVYAHLNEGRKLHTDSSMLRAMAYRLNSQKPIQACPECRGETASEDADDCKRCLGKGFLTREDSK